MKFRGGCNFYPAWLQDFLVKMFEKESRTAVARTWEGWGEHVLLLPMK